jgi:hypothetical protein
MGCFAYTVKLSKCYSARLTFVDADNKVEQGPLKYGLQSFARKVIVKIKKQKVVELVGRYFKFYNWDI